MSLPITDGPAVVLNQEGNIAFELPCLRCRYDLRKLNPAGQCPECGYPIGGTIEDYRLKHLPQHWKADQALGFALMGLIFPPCGLVALWVGRKAIDEIDRNPGQFQGRGQAVAARVLGALETIVTCGFVLFALMLPSMGSARCTARKMQGSTQLRGIHQQLVVFAQSNKGWFPGLTPTGVVDGKAALSNRYGSIGRMKLEDYYTAEYLVSPAEADPTVNGVVVKGSATSYGSFAILEFANPKKLLAQPTTLGKLEWRESLNTMSVVISDRQLATGNATPRSIWTSVNGQWQGSVLFNDNHVQFELTDKAYDGQYGQNRGKFGTGSINNLFDLKGGNGRMTSD